MSGGDTEIPVSEDYATSEEPTMPILVEEGLASSMLREPLHIHDNDAYSSSEEPTMPKLTIEGTITGTSKKVSPSVSATERKAVTPLVNMARLSPTFNGVSTDLPANPVQNSIEKIVTGITTPKAETNPLGRKRRRTKTPQNLCDPGTQVAQLRRVGKHSCNLCQSTDSTTPKRPQAECNLSEVKRTRRKENPGPTEKLFAPLKLGWIREIVSRHVSSHAKQDVYYHPPYGKKLRSLVEIGKYLKQENMTALLTVDNFTFFAEPLGYGEPFEVSRGAFMRSRYPSKANGSPKKEPNLTPKKGYHIKKPKLTPKNKNKPKTKAKSAKQKSVEKMAKHTHEAESSDEEYQVITEIAEGDEGVALHLETGSLEIGHQAEAVVKNTKVQIKKEITHASEQGNIFSSPERKEAYQETKNPKCIASTQSLVISPGSVSEAYVTRTGSPKRIRITAGNKNGNSSMNKKMAEHCRNVQKPVEFPQEDQLSPKESYSIKVNETHEGEHNNQHETEKNSLSRHNNYISLNPVGINDRDEHYKVSETAVHKKSKRKRIEKNMNGRKLTGKEKLGIQKQQIMKEKPFPSEVLFVASGILENFEEDHVKATELSDDTTLTILPTLHIKEEPVENEFLPVISSVKSGKEAEEMLETSEEPLRLWFNQTLNPQTAQRGKAIGAQPRNTNNYPEINGQKTDKTTVVSRRQLKTNLGSTNIVKEQNFVPQNDKTTSTVPFQISSNKKSNDFSQKKNPNMNRKSVTQTMVKKTIQPMVSLPVSQSEMCNTIMNVKPQNSHSVFGNLNLQSQEPSSMQNPATAADSLQNPVTVTDSSQTVATCEILRPSSVKNGITAVISNESDSQNFEKQEGEELLRELLTKEKTEENHLNHEIPIKSKFAHLITINRKQPRVQQSAMLPLNPNQPSATDTQVHQIHLNSFAPHLPGISVASQIYPSLASFTPQIVMSAKQPPGPQSASFLLKQSQSGVVFMKPINTPLRSVAPYVPGTLVTSLPSFSPLAISTKQPPFSQSANLPLNPNKARAADKHAHYTPLYSFDPNKPVSSVASQVCHSPPSFTRDEQTH